MHRFDTGKISGVLPIGEIMYALLKTDDDIFTKEEIIKVKKEGKYYTTLQPTKKSKTIGFYLYPSWCKIITPEDDPEYFL